MSLTNLVFQESVFWLENQLNVQLYNIEANSWERGLRSVVKIYLLEGGFKPLLARLISLCADVICGKNGAFKF
jgi:hypothetical protein